jgi:ribosomal protein S15P/S13E
MMELPPEINQAIGVSMTSRKFRTKNIEIGDRSVWTDTPAEKARKEKEGHTRRSTATEEQQGVLLSGRDKELKEIVEKHNKDHRNVSLYELHRKRKTENADDGVNERKPFNRETDLQLPQNVITNAKRQTLIKDSSKSLNNKFTHGKKHFL